MPVSQELITEYKDAYWHANRRRVGDDYVSGWYVIFSGDPYWRKVVRGKELAMMAANLRDRPLHPDRPVANEPGTS